MTFQGSLGKPRRTAAINLTDMACCLAGKLRRTGASSWLAVVVAEEVERAARSTIVSTPYQAALMRDADSSANFPPMEKTAC